MKLKFKICDLRFAIWKKSSGAVSTNSQSGIALVLTLILLSVTLVMAVAFLLMSRREQGSVTTQTDAATARYAADSALAAAQAQIAANIFAGAQPDPFSYGLLVSTNFINPLGWAPGLTNVNYDFTQANSNQLTTFEYLKNLTNLFYAPRPPVFFPSATNANVFNDFRFYLDLNRNGRYETNGFPGNFITNNSGQLVFDGTTNFQIGDPEWIGVLERPDLPHGPNNHFIARYAYIALPVGNTLDLNAIHNQAAHPPLPSNPVLNTVNPPLGSGGNHNDYFIRNESVGGWENNLAGFLADLNTNKWGTIIGTPANGNSTYYYYQYPGATIPPPFVSYVNRGFAFDNARELLAYRYNNSFSTLSNALLFFNDGGYAFGHDNIDGYTFTSPMMTNFSLPPEIDSALMNPATTNAPWVGANNVNHFFDLPSDLFDRTKTATGVSQSDINNGLDFTSRLTNSGTGGDTYNRYTFYRLLSQLGTDSQPDSGKMNLNYDNLDVAGNVIPGAETNCVPWTNSIKFFTNAADRLLRAYTARWATSYVTNDIGVVETTSNLDFIATFNGTTNAPFYVTNAFGIGNIPVFVNGRFVYTPAVNRLLQLAANIYDATRTNFYPSVFRPLFSRDENGLGTNLYITGFTNFVRTDFIQGQEQNDPDLAVPIEPVLLAMTNNTVINEPVNVYGVPWIIGAKKWLPNFNQFAMESKFELDRKLQLIRADLTDTNIIATNQMYQMTFSNYYAMVCWNSYRSNYPAPVEIFSRCFSFMNLTIMTNDNIPFYPDMGGGYTNGYAFTNWLFYPATTTISQWQGGSGANGQGPNLKSFAVPLNVGKAWFSSTNVATFFYNEPEPNSKGAYFTFDTNYPPSDAGIRQLPHFELFTTNRLQVAIIDFSQNPDLQHGRIVDYVQLGGLDNDRVLNDEIHPPVNDSYHQFDTNLDNGTPSSSGAIMGVYNQIEASGYGHTFNPNVSIPDSANGWTSGQIPNGPNAGNKPAAQQAYFLGFFNQDGEYKYNDGTGSKTYWNTNLSVQAPYTASVVSFQYLTWEANDPLVHYLSSDLTPLAKASGDIEQTFVQFPTPSAFNRRYQPWGRNPPSYESNVDTNTFNVAFKDPLVYESSDWDFPTNVLPTVGWLGRVHRGTPWQSIYLKSTNILEWNSTNSGGQSGYTTWAHWTGNGNSFDVINMAPKEDWPLFDLFTTQFDDNATRGRLSVNAAPNSLAAWSAVFSGIQVVANTNKVTVGMQRRSESWPRAPLGIVLTNIQPAGPDLNSALAQIVTNIDKTRSKFRNPDGLVGVFEHRSDIMAAAKLSDQSPFINTNQNSQIYNATDEIYEWLPQQIMPLLSGGDQPARYVIYTWGQSLQPAPGGVYLGNDNFFGMVTNYQVTSETATRAVVEIQGAETNNPHIVIKSFNILPPD